MIQLTDNAARLAYGALQELKWRAEEGDATARLSDAEENVRAELEDALFPDGAERHVPWGAR